MVTRPLTGKCLRSLRIRARHWLVFIGASHPFPADAAAAILARMHGRIGVVGRTGPEDQPVDLLPAALLAAGGLRLVHRLERLERIATRAALQIVERHQTVSRDSVCGCSTTTTF